MKLTKPIVVDEADEDALVLKLKQLMDLKLVMNQTQPLKPM